MLNNIFNNCKAMYNYEMITLHNNDSTTLFKCFKNKRNMNNKLLNIYFFQPPSL